jgi:hypothetical protein
MTIRRGACCISGPDRAANMLEVVVVPRDAGSELAIHAMRMRTRYKHLLARGRPLMGSEAAAVFHVRLPPRLREAWEQAADAQETTPSDISCQALAEYLVRNAQASPDEP